MSDAVIVAGARTPIGKLAGSLAGFSAVELAGLVIVEALRRGGVSPEHVGHVVLGQVIQAGQGQNPARQAAARGGIPMSIPAITINKVCLSGLHSLYYASLLISAGEADVVVAGGMESMSNAPHLLAGARSGFRFGGAELRDAIQSDGLECAFDEVQMGAATDRYAGEAGISRERQDAWAAESHSRAAKATSNGHFAEEILPIEVPQPRAEPRPFLLDEGVRDDTTVDRLTVLRPAFSASGTVTAGNASQLSDGAAAVVVASPEFAARLGIEPLGMLVGYGQVAGPDPSLLTQPARAIRRALHVMGRHVDDIDLFEINEAFAAVAVASSDELGVRDDIVNVNGGAIVLGHPIGMSGARLALTICHELRRRGGGLGAAALCGGGGQGDAALLRVG